MDTSTTKSTKSAKTLEKSVRVTTPDFSQERTHRMARDRDDINSQKQLALRRLFEDDWMLIHVDTRIEGVAVPDNLKHTPSVTFKLSRLFQGATEISDSLVTAQLLFGSTRQTCTFPYDGIWGATSFKGSNIVWPESAPKEVLAQLEKGTVTAEPVPELASQTKVSKVEKSKSAPSRSHLRRVK